MNNPITAFRERRRAQREAEIRTAIMLEIANPRSMVAVAFNVEVNKELDRRLRDILRGRRIAHCYVCLGTDQLYKTGNGAMACKTHAVIR